MTIPTIYTWPLLTPTLPAPSTIVSTSYLAPSPGSGIATCNPQYFTEEDLLALLDRVFPEWYLQPLKDPGPGYELYQTFAATLSDVSLAVGHFECASFIIFSHGGFQATAAVEFYRASTFAGGFTILEGTIVRTSKTNRSYYLTADVVFGAGDYIVPGLVRAVAPGAEYNVRGPVFTADGTLLQGEIDLIPLPFLDPVFAEPTIQVRQIADAENGQSAVLDQLGLDRRLPRLPNETDEVYKGRIRQLPDTVSPSALVNQLNAIFLPFGLSYVLIETWQNRYQSCWDAPLGDISNPVMGVLLEGTFAYDDPRTEPFFGRWMDERDFIAGIIVVVPNTTSWAMRGMAYDDAGADVGISPDSFTTALGRRATSAYDAPADDTEFIYAPAYDGDDLKKNLFYKHLWDLLRQVKGGGVHVSIELAGQ